MAKCHECAPPEWRKTPNVTGDSDFDESLRRSKNADVPGRIKLYVTRDPELAYGNLTGYSGYSGYHGDN